MKKYIPALVGVVTLSLVVACNLYAPLAANSSTDDHLEEAQKCLHDGNFACAVENYNKLPDGDLKNQKLCTVNMARAGFSLSNMINTVTQKSQNVLGDLASNISPWSAEKKTAADEAYTHCENYQKSSSSGDLGILVRTLSRFLYCANRLSKADQFQGTSNSDTECTAEGNRDGRVDESDVSATTDGTVGGSGKAMCAQDALDCNEALSSLSAAALSDAGLGDIGNALSEVPPELKDQAQKNPDIIRKSLRLTVD